MLTTYTLQVQNIHIKSLSLSRGIRTPSPGTSTLPYPVVGPAHLRSDSLPAQAYLSSTPSPPGVSPLLTRKVHEPGTLSPPSKASTYGSQQLLSPTSKFPDSMAEYTPTDLDWSNSRAYPEMHRLSVAW